MNSIRCPACGVAVALGYARCPKCHAPMPAAGPRGKRDTQQGGGTSAATAAPSVAPWLVIGVLVLAGGGVVAWAMTRRDAGPRSATPDEAAAPVEEAGGELLDVAPPPPPEAPVRRDPAGAADRLERALAGQRLYGKAALRGEVLELRSSFCGEPGLVAVVDAARGDLAGEGLTAVTCLEPHGAEVFSRRL
jgi:hypothetical protein